MKKILIVAVFCLTSLNIRAMQSPHDSCGIENKIDVITKIIDYLREENYDAAHELEESWNEQCPYDTISVHINDHNNDWSSIL